MISLPLTINLFNHSVVIWPVQTIVNYITCA
jgi:hypothetical protein